MEEAEKWRQVVDERQLMCENFSKARAALDKGNWKEFRSWRGAAAMADNASHCLANAIEAFVIGTPAKMQKALEWQEAAEEYKLACHKWSKAAEAYAVENNEEGDSYDKEAQSALDKARRLEFKIKK